MHRFILKGVLLIGLITHGLTHAKTFKPETQQWIDAHPVVRFIIHEKYAPYLLGIKGEESPAVFKDLLQKITKYTEQEFQAKWRKNDQEGFHQLANGQVDFIIDPPSLENDYLQFGSKSEAIFWGHDAVITKHSQNAGAIAPENVAFFERGFENPPYADDTHNSISEDLHQLFANLLKHDVQAIVLPMRLAQLSLQTFNNPSIKIDGLYGREPFAYRWLISHQDAPLHDVVESFLKNLDPIESRQLFAPELNTMQAGNRHWKTLPLLISIGTLFSGSFLFWWMRKKQLTQEKISKQLLCSKEIAEKANAAKSEFLATMSHEIRTPMNVILGVQELLLSSQQLPPHQKSLLKSAHASAESLLGILNQVLDLSKIEAGKLTLNLEPCSLNALIDDIDSSFSAVAKKQGLVLHTSKDVRIAEVLMIDALRLRQILQNLISNAIKFTECGEIYFSISILADDHAGQLIEFRVIDTGIGMGKDEIALALQAFEQIPGRGDQQNGTGLGLTITNHLVKSMNSQLYFESAPGFGSNIHFCVAFPRTSIAASRNAYTQDEINPLKKLSSDKSIAEKRSLQALIVEDHPASRQIISLQLQALGIGVSVCENANTALKMIEDKNYDLLLTDQSIPGMQGSELAQKIRSLGFGDLIIIGVTADIYALESRHQFLEAGMNSVLIKPLSLMTLENELARYFLTIGTEDSDNSPLGEYSFDAFSNVLRDNPDHILIILQEIKRVHDDALKILSSETIEEDVLASLIHKVKGGAQLLSASNFIRACESLEQEKSPQKRIRSFKKLLEDQNQIIEQYHSQYSTPKPLENKR
ncbi:ATP-binding protein [Polynucleobacter necessarius]|uniref:ATP-binding protein n=1 Tax=Polynucleobacter necessarius TaxID=576610 RepID=UPI000E096965|nr:ATP-binding protein [Polynucleobacter necessarius]